MKTPKLCTSLKSTLISLFIHDHKNPLEPKTTLFLKPMLSFKCQELDQLGISPQKEGKHTAQQIENMVT